MTRGVPAITIVALLMSAAPAAAVPLTRISSDPFTNGTSMHATEVEPDTFAHHGTVVTTFQVGRFFNGGASDIGAVRSGDGGSTWDAPTLPARPDVQRRRRLATRQPVRARQ